MSTVLNIPLLKRTSFHLATIILLSLLVYLNSLHNGFVWDDHDIIEGNPLLTGVRNISTLIVSEDTFLGERTGYYRPVPYLSFFLDRTLWGTDPFMFHLVNLLLHIGVAVALYSLVFLLFHSGSLAFFAALVFSLHPANAETVNFLSGGRNTLLSALFMVIAFILHIRRRFLLAGASFFLSVFSKEFGLLLPVLLALNDGFARHSFPASTMRNSDMKGAVQDGQLPGRRVIRYLPYLLVIIFYLTVRSLVLGGSGLPSGIDHLVNRILQIPEIMLKYLSMLAFPFPLKIPYVIRPRLSLDLDAALYVFGFCSLCAALFLIRRLRVLLFSCLWIILFLLPVTNVIPLGPIRMAERYAYFSSMGFSMLLAYLFLALKRPIGSALLVFIVTAYCLVVVGRNPVWKNSHTLFRQMVADSPESSIGYYNLGIEHYAKGDVEGAARYLETASRTYPVTASTLTTLAGVYLDQNDFEKARLLLQRALVLEPDNFRALLMMSRIYRSRGDHVLEESYLKRVSALLPDVEVMLRKKAFTTCEKAEAVQAENKLDEAEMLFRRALLYYPDFARAIIGLGSVIAQKGDIDKAIGYFAKAAELEPDNPIPHYDLSMAYKVKGLPRESRVEMDRFLLIKGGSANQ